MKVVAIIQARTGSTRLPGKVLVNICGRSMLEWVVARTRLARTLNDVVVATTVALDDEAIVTECDSIGVSVFRGSEEDVLDRYCRAAETFLADIIVRITSDCPLIDPEIIDRVVDAFKSRQVDYASNTLERGYPRGLDTEVISRAALMTASSNAEEPYERVHVTPYVYLHPKRFALLSVPCPEDHSRLRWTVDTVEDLQVVRGIATELDGQVDFGWREALEIVHKNPGLSEMNREIRQKTLEEG